MIKKTRTALGLAINLAGGVLGAQFLVQWLSHSVG